MCDARAKVAGGVDGVAGGAAERESDGPHEDADHIGTMVEGNARGP